MTEYLIIGGGVYGMACAWELSRRGAAVRVIEAQTIAGAASGGPGQRGVRGNKRDRRELPLMALAYERWQQLHQELDCSACYERTGSLTLIEREQDLQGAPARVWLQNRLGVASSLIGQHRLREMEPEIAQEVLAAIYCENDGVARHADTTRHFADAARRAGTRIDEHCPMAKLEMHGSRVSAAITQNGERIPISKACLLLANSAVARLLQDAGGPRLPLWNTALQVLLIKPAAPISINHLIGHLSRTVAVKAESEGQVMVSGGYRGVWHQDRHRGETLPEAVQANVVQAAAVFPALNGATVQISDANHLEAMSIDDIPIIDRLADDSNLYFAAGWSGHGWAIAPVVSRLLSDWVLSGSRPDLLAPFGYRRFDPGGCKI